MNHIYHTTLLLLMIGLMFIPQWTAAQSINHHLLSHGLSEDVERQTIEQGTDLEKALTILEKKYGILFLYRSQLLDQKTIPNIEVIHQNRELSDILQSLLHGSDLTYRQISHRTIGITPEDSFEEMIDIYQETIRGTVVDAQTGEALPGVNIVVEGTTTGTTTNMDGEYELNVPSLEETLIISFVGYQRLEVAIDGRTELNLDLVPDVQLLDDVVVIGYGSIQRSDLTGSVSSVRAEDLTTGVQASVDQAIQGRIAGVQVTQTSAQPGGGFSIRIRGAGSITASNEPLYVIDGVPGSAPLNSLNPADIESIEVLKDASATAIYGARGANGVILVTTKQGQQGAPLEINYSASIGIQESAKKLDMMDAQEYMTFVNALSIDRGESPRFTQDQMNAIGSGTNWQNEILRTAPLQEHRISFSGGSEDTQYYLSLNYFDQDGIVINTNFQRYSGRVNLRHSLGERLRVGLNLNNSVEHETTVPLGLGVNQTAGVIATAYQLEPVVPVRNEDGTFAQSPQDLSNSVALARTVDNTGKVNRMFGTIYGEYRLFENLNTRINLGFNQRSAERDIFWNNQTQRGQLLEAQASRSMNENSNYLFEFTTEYDQEFNNIHRINIVGGYSYQKFENKGFNASAQNFPTTAFGSNNLGAGEQAKNLVGSTRSENTLLSGFGRINYNYSDKYLVTATFRADGSSRFGEDNKFAYFPSAALAWRISNESFFPTNGFFSRFSEVKLRGSFGISGNQEIGNHNSLVLLGSAPPAIYGGQEFEAIAPVQLANPDIRWETTEQINVGFDFGLWDDRLMGSVEYFRSDTKDLLLNLPIPTTTGFSSSLQNVGDTRNSGFEFTLNSRNLVGEFSWTTNLNFATLQNKVLNLGELPRILQGGTRFITEMTLLNVGDTMNSYYGYVVEGVWQSQEEIDSNPSQPNARPGDLRFKDVNGDGVINQNDRTIIGDPFPDFTLGLHNNFGYKGFALDVFIEGRFGYELANFTNLDSDNPIDHLRNRQRYVLDRWTQDNPTNKQPSFVNQDRTFDFNTRIVQDASFLRLKNVRLSYEFPSLDFAGISSLSVFATGQNLITITDYEGLNPDINVLGSSNVRLDYSAYPLQRIYTFGVNVRI